MSREAPRRGGRDVRARSCRQRLLELLRASIAKRMMADVPFGVFLSGGVDSSTNVALMSELMDEPVRTFSVAFTEHERYNELRVRARDRAAVRDRAPRGGDRRRTTRVGSCPSMIHHQDEPIADWVCVPLHFVAQAGARQRHDRRAGRRGLRRAVPRLQGLHRRSAASGGASGSRSSACRPVRRGTSRRRRASRRLGRGDPSRGPVADAAAGRLPFWGGAICFRGERQGHACSDQRPRAPDSYDVVERLWHDAERARPGRRPAPGDDLPGAQAAAAGAAADARRQDDDGDLGRGARAVPRPRPGRVRARAAAAR